jgi:hypothetical protein
MTHCVRVSYITREGILQARGSAFAHARPAQAGHAQKPYLAIEDRAEFAGMGEETLRSHFYSAVGDRERPGREAG